MPLHFLGKAKGWGTHWGFLADAVAMFLENEDALDQFLHSTDLLVLPRFYVLNEHRKAAEGFINSIRAFGIHVVYEVDDDYTNEHKKVIEGDAISVAGLADAVTVTTPYLAETMHKRTGLPTYVLPNMLDPQLWRNGTITRKAGPDMTIIGLTGSFTHYEDWKVLKDVLPAVLEKHPNSRLVVAGFTPDYLEGLPQTEYFAGFAYPAYSQFIRQCDIILAPVDPADGFNMGKSPIKAVEGMGATRLVENRFAGAAVVATDNPIYRLAVRNEQNGLLVEYTPDAWFNALDRLLTDHEYRHRLQFAAHRSAWKDWDISRHWTKWAKAYRDILKLPIRTKEIA
jgi:glycosyltransferase involved in cell wall biosynthesis